MANQNDHSLAQQDEKDHKGYLLCNGRDNHKIKLCKNDIKP